MERRSLLLSAAILLAAPAVASPGAGLRAAHAFGPDPAREDVVLELRLVAGDVRMQGGAAVDHADYSGVGRLSVAREVEIGAPGAASLVPPGTYDVDFLPSAGLGPAVRLAGAGGLALQVPLPVVPPPAERVASLRAEPLEDAGPSWLVALHAPTVSGLLVLAPAGGGRVEPAPSPSSSASPPSSAEAGDRMRPRTRGDLVRERTRGRTRPESPRRP